MSADAVSSPLVGRLRRLREQSGRPTLVAAGVAPSVADSSTPTFAERVKRLMGTPRSAAPVVPDDAALASALDAERLAPGVLLVERRLAVRLRHGARELHAAAAREGVPGALQPLVSVAGALPAAPRSVFIDTETSGLAGGSGTWAFMTGLLWADAGGWMLRQYLLTRLDAEPAYLAAVAAALGADDLLVSYNGRAFDLPLLNVRYRLAALADPFAALAHLDLLGATRRAFARRWDDCRLASAERLLLGFVRQDDLPGAAAPAAWRDWLQAGRSAGLAGVLRHNRWDLLSLAGLLPVLAMAFEQPDALGADVRAIAAMHLARGEHERAHTLLGAAEERLDPPGLLDLARLCRRRGDWPHAVAIWQRLAAAEPCAREALAKYYEHHGGDLTAALELTLTLAPDVRRERRLARLRRKLAADACKR